MAVNDVNTISNRSSLMHPRNIYHQPIDFKQLVTTYPDLRPYVKVSLSGQATFDFKNAAALAELTKTLLKRDFNLSVEIPANKLVPTLPLRLNYILWMEDLLNHVGITSEINGIDIGTGASCIYPLLAAKKGWNMLGTELDTSSVTMASHNVVSNNLSNLIEIQLVPDPNLVLQGVIDDSKTYHFCMCNPPFFHVSEVPKNRTKRRRSPSNGRTGSQCELETNGGECNFIKKIIKDSQTLRNKILVYSTMIGIKENFVSIREELKRSGPLSISWTEFHQGRVTRWGIAWSYKFHLPMSEVKRPKSKAKQKDKPISILICDYVTSSDSQISQIKEILLANLQFSFDVDNDDPFTCSVSAFKNTWANQRRKRREVKRALEKSSGSEGNNSMNGQLDVTPEETSEGVSKQSKNGQEAKTVNGGVTGVNGEVPNKGTTDSEVTSNDPILEFKLKLCLEDEGTTLQFVFLTGSAGKCGLYEIAQYFKNKMKN